MEVDEALDCWGVIGVSQHIHLRPAGSSGLFDQPEIDQQIDVIVDRTPAHIGHLCEIGLVEIHSLCIKQSAKHPAGGWVAGQLDPRVLNERGVSVIKRVFAICNVIGSVFVGSLLLSHTQPIARKGNKFCVPYCRLVCILLHNTYYGGVCIQLHTGDVPGVEVTKNMADSNVEDEIRATVAVKCWRFYTRNKTPVTVQVLSQQGIRKDLRGDAKAIIREMAENDAAPIEWDRKDLDRVTLAGADREENAGWVRSRVTRHDPDYDLPWNLK